jgi:hypothetical protein
MRSFAAVLMIPPLGHASPRPVAAVLAASALGGDAWLLAWVGALLTLWLLRFVRNAGGLARPPRRPSWPRLRRGGLKVLGVHPVRPTDPLVQATLASRGGENLTGDGRQRAEEEVRSHFAGLYLIEVEIAPRTPDFLWSEVTQQVPGVPRESWQVPYDERPLDEPGRWAFFFHCLDLAKPLLTPAGPVTLPAPSPTPERLRTIEYEAP